MDIRSDYESATIENNVGYSEDTIINFARLLNSYNARLPMGQKYTDDQLCVKVLGNICHPESLAHEAVSELKADPGSRKFERQVQINGQNVHIRIYQDLVTHFDKLWRGLFKQGIIRSRAAGKRHDAGALLVERTQTANCRNYGQ